MRTIDRLFQLLGYEPFRCFDCGERSHLNPPPDRSPGLSFPPSEAKTAQCPNCRQETEIRLTPGERHMAGSEGWLVSCPACKALFPFIRPTNSP
jgi:hypothetical protein